jgi:hypothetical protein
MSLKIYMWIHFLEMESQMRVHSVLKDSSRSFKAKIIMTKVIKEDFVPTKPDAHKKKTRLKTKENRLLAVARNANPRGAEPTRGANNRPIIYNANSG